MPVEVDPSLCPLCQGKNHCGNLENQSANNIDVAKFECWCMDKSIDPKMLESLPESVKGKSCVCRACVLAYKG